MQQLKRDFRVFTHPYTEKDFSKWQMESNYPCTYILEDGEHAYIGATGNLKERTEQHRRDLKKLAYPFQHVHEITGPRANGSTAYHFERLLIRSMRVDQRFQILNRNDGIKTYDYFEKNEYELDFDRLWIRLEEKGLVNETTFQQIFNRDVYKFSPDTALHKGQIKALKSALRILRSRETEPPGREYQSRPVLISGEAGTGKTLVAVTLFYHLRHDDAYQGMRIALVVACTPLREVLQRVFDGIEGLDKGDVIGPVEVTKRRYDLIICDETHKLRRRRNLNFYNKPFAGACARLDMDADQADELDWVFQQSDYQVLFYDPKQRTSPTDMDGAYFERRLRDMYRGRRPVTLKRQMRVRAGRQYVPYIYDILYQRIDPQRPDARRQFKKYDFRLFDSFEPFVRAIAEKEKQCGWSRLCGGYGWKWQKGKSEFDIAIEGYGVKWNSQTVGWRDNPACKDEMGSIYTLQGFDLNYAGVVIGPELYYDVQTCRIVVDKRCFFDNTVKKGSGDTELEAYILNAYGVLLTRAISGTYIYVCDENLRRYLQAFIERA